MRILFVASGTGDGKPYIIVNNQAKSLEKLGVKVNYFVNSKKGFLGYLNNMISLIKHLRKNKYDLIHSHYSMSAFVSTMAILLNFKFRVGHVVSLMGSDTKSKGMSYLITSLLKKHFWDVTIVKSKSMLKNGRIKGEYVLPNGVDLSAIESKDSKKIKSDELTVLFTGDPKRESKNFTLAERAINLIKSNKIKFKLICGVSHKQIIDEMRNADVLLLTSKWEGSPNVIKEAMACNLPIVATDVGDIKWIFGDTEGCYLTSFEPDDVAEKLRMALKFAKEKGITNGRERMIKLGLDSETVAKKLVEIYKNAIGRE